MIWLVDTNVLAELSRREPNPGVLRWADTVGQVALSVITVEELSFGLALRPNPRLQQLYDEFLAQRCALLPITSEIARHAGRLRGELRSRGLQRTQADLLIASTAALHGLSLVTRNVRDFEGCGIALLDPWI